MTRLRERARQIGKRFAARRSRHTAPDTSDQTIARGTPQDVTSPRAKSQGHKKSTADKWNQ